LFLITKKVPAWPLELAQFHEVRIKCRNGYRVLLGQTPAILGHPNPDSKDSMENVRDKISYFDIRTILQESAAGKLLEKRRWLLDMGLALLDLHSAQPCHAFVEAPIAQEAKSPQRLSMEHNLHALADGWVLGECDKGFETVEVWYDHYGMKRIGSVSSQRNLRDRRTCFQVSAIYITEY
jgi:hypothetical protein